MWRTFVYNPEIDKDRIKRSYKEFLPLDGKFDDNVVLQTKNGALDFQPSEPAQPLFGSMKYTSLMPELQITPRIYRAFYISGLFIAYVEGVLGF